MSYYGISSDGASSFFNSYFGTAGTNSSGVSLGDWTMIKSGAYKKLLNAYYEKEGTGKKKSDKSADSSTAVEDSSVKLSVVSGDAESLVTAAGKLSSTVKSSSSTQDDLYKVASDYVESYNKMIKAATDVNNKSVLRNELNITNNTKANDDLLEDVGITIGSDNKLSINETKFKNAERADLTSLFTGYSSYVSHVSNSAEKIYNSAKSAVSNTSKACSYTNSGTYSKLLSNVSSYDSSI